MTSRINRKRIFRPRGKIIEGEVVDLGAYRKQVRDREDYYNIVLVSSDGKFVFNPDDYVLVELTHMDQVDALIDGDLGRAEADGAAVIPVIDLLADRRQG